MSNSSKKLSDNPDVQVRFGGGDKERFYKMADNGSLVVEDLGKLVKSKGVMDQLERMRKQVIPGAVIVRTNRHTSKA